MEPNNKIQQADGLLIGLTEVEDPVWSVSHTAMTFAATGRDTFAAAIAPNLLLYSGNCFVVDPSGEACAVTARARQEQHGQRVYRLDPFDLLGKTTNRSVPAPVRINPLDLLSPSSPTFQADASLFVEAIFANRSNADNAFWIDNAKQLVTALVLFVCSYPHPREHRNLTRVYHYLSLNNIENKWLSNEMGKVTHPYIQGTVNAMSSMAEKTLAGIVATARAELAIFADPTIEWTTGTSDFDLNELILARCTVYLILPPQYMKTHGGWLRLMFTASLLPVHHQRSTQAGPSPLWLIDEAAQIGATQALANAHNLSRGWGIRVWSFWQSLHQLQVTYPANWQTMIIGSAVQLMSVGDAATADFFAELDRTPDTQSRERLRSMPPDQVYFRQPDGGGSFLQKCRYYDNQQLAERADPNLYYPSGE